MNTVQPCSHQAGASRVRPWRRYADEGLAKLTFGPFQEGFQPLNIMEGPVGLVAWTMGEEC